MCHPLASRPHCSLSIIRHDYALLPAKAASANTFTLTIIIFRPCEKGSGHRADRGSVSKDAHHNSFKLAWGGLRSTEGFKLMSGFDHNHELMIRNVAILEIFNFQTELVGKILQHYWSTVADCVGRGRSEDLNSGHKEGRWGKWKNKPFLWLEQLWEQKVQGQRSPQLLKT